MLVSEAFAAEAAPTPANSVLGEEVDSSECVGRIMADFNFSNSFGLERKTKELTKRCGFPEDTDTGINWAYLGQGMDFQKLLPVRGILLVILLSGYLIIYNIFYINVFHDIRHYGLLKTIGTTGKQLRRIVRRQAYMLCLYGIPLGLVLGGITGKWILPSIMGSLVFSQTADTKISLNMWIFAASVLFSLLTVYISCIKPCRIASSVSPVEAVRYTEGQGKLPGKKKDRKTKKVNPLSMAVGKMAYACGLQYYGAFEDNFILPDEEYLNFLGESQPMRTLFNAEKDQEENVEKWLSGYCGKVDTDLDYVSKATVAAQFDGIKNMYTMVGGLLAFILAAIGILNFINTMATSILSRKQEFAMMEAVGMTGKQLLHLAFYRDTRAALHPRPCRCGSCGSHRLLQRGG